MVLEEEVEGLYYDYSMSRFSMSSNRLWIVIASIYNTGYIGIYEVWLSSDFDDDMIVLDSY